MLREIDKDIAFPDVMRYKLSDKSCRDLGSAHWCQLKQLTPIFLDRDISVNLMSNLVTDGCSGVRSLFGVVNSEFGFWKI
ncbi:MAG: hypothetical protein HC789_09330 [Microcoleus sp. CSU_2_2]|nr:hypothetical protein [Microcoleus sp. CSU_2_2]